MPMRDAERLEAGAGAEATASRLRARAAVATPKSAAGSSAATPASGGPNTWSDAEDAKLKKALSKFGPETSGRWEKIAAEVRTRARERGVRARASAACRRRLPIVAGELAE